MCQLRNAWHHTSFGFSSTGEARCVRAAVWLGLRLLVIFLYSLSLACTHLWGVRLHRVQGSFPWRALSNSKLRRLFVLCLSHSAPPIQYETIQKYCKTSEGEQQVFWDGFQWVRKSDREGQLLYDQQMNATRRARRLHVGKPGWRPSEL